MKKLLLSVIACCVLALGLVPADSSASTPWRPPGGGGIGVQVPCPPLPTNSCADCQARYVAETALCDDLSDGWFERTFCYAEAQATLNECLKTCSNC
jgi:hypothetical protein